MSAICPHCQSETPGEGEFCADCGKALPIASKGPRIIGDKEFATSTTGKAVQSDELKQKVRAAFSILLIVGIFQLINGLTLAGTGISGVANSANTRSTAANTSAGLVVYGAIFVCTGLAFIGMSIWARFQPLAAAIAGLSLYCLIFIGQIVLLVLAQSMTGNIFFRIIVIAALAKAVQAGFQHRELKRRLAAEGAIAAA